MLTRAKRGDKLNSGDRPEALIEAARNDPKLTVQGFKAEAIIQILEGAVADDDSPAFSAMSAYVATVNDKGIISLPEPVELKEGTHILVTLADKDRPIAPMRWSSQTALSGRSGSAKSCKRMKRGPTC